MTTEPPKRKKNASRKNKKSWRKNVNIDDVEDLADDMAEMMDDFNEINEALGRNFATPDDIDEADLDAELEMLEDEMFDEEEALGEDATPSYLQATSEMPELPTTAFPNPDVGLPAMPN